MGGGIGFRGWVWRRLTRAMGCAGIRIEWSVVTALGSVGGLRWHRLRAMGWVALLSRGVAVALVAGDRLGAAALASGVGSGEILNRGRTELSLQDARKVNRLGGYDCCCGYSAGGRGDRSDPGEWA